MKQKQKSQQQEKRVLEHQLSLIYIGRTIFTRIHKVLAFVQVLKLIMKLIILVGNGCYILSKLKILPKMDTMNLR